MASHSPSDLLPSLLAGVIVYPQEDWSPQIRTQVEEHLRCLARELRCVISLARRGAAEAGVVLDLSTNGGVADPLAWDARVHELESDSVFELGVRLSSPALELEAFDALLRRYQRLLPLPAHVPSPELARVLALHRSLHDLTLPLVRADYDHALDTWRWLLWLAPRADLALQCAALFHDVERLESEPLQRTEHLAPDYVSFKRAHARRGAELVGAHLSTLGLPADDLREIQRLVSHHERPDADPRLQLLNDADGLSFFSLNGYGYLRYFGPAVTRDKIRYTSARLSPRTRVLVRALPLHPRVRELLDAEVNTLDPPRDGPAAWR